MNTINLPVDKFAVADAALAAEATAPETASAVSAGILDTIKRVEHSTLSIGLALVNIRDNKLYREMGHKNMSSYVLYLVRESQKDRSSIYKWLQIGEIYLKYREKLTEIGFGSKDGLTKLPYLERALKDKPQKEVYDNIMAMTQRDFSKYARSIVADNAETIENAEEDTKEDIEEWGYRFSYRGKEAVRVNKNMGRRALNMMLPAIRLAFNAIDRKSHVVAVHLDNSMEKRLFIPIINKARDELRARIRERLGARIT